ncbi:MAG: hypothetical protein B6229_00365 [Spirochaetaceae bacterium 4572_7]|nr:MAG: hypothetical protein B6229_00365 [Spirochaetaceae bacterium 4572_7]
MEQYKSPTANIEKIELDFKKGETSFNDVPLVKTYFKFPCEWTVLHSEDLKQILKLWIQGEKKKLNGKYQDAYWLQQLIIDVFKEEDIIFGEKEVEK